MWNAGKPRPPKSVTVSNFDTIYKITSSGDVSVFADASSGLSGPIGLAFDASGTLYAANYVVGNILKFTPGGVGSVYADSVLRSITVDEARGLIRESTPVVVTYRKDDPPPPQLHELWKEMGSPRPDSEAVSQTLSRIVRPGTLIFILSSRENVALP
jgi:hypothetical protein